MSSWSRISKWHKVILVSASVASLTSLVVAAAALYYSRSLKMQTLNGGSSTVGPELLHPMEEDTPYRLWNAASGSLLQRDSISPGNAINCNGSLLDMDYNTVATTLDAGRAEPSGLMGETKYAFLFKDSAKSTTSFVLNATNDGKSLMASVYTSEADLTASMRFEPSYYWSFTIFKNMAYNTLYLGCSGDGRALLVPMNSKHYPDPQALFITNEYNLSDNILIK